jgi:hypothetical protein
LFGDFKGAWLYSGQRSGRLRIEFGVEGDANGVRAVGRSRW